MNLWTDISCLLQTRSWLRAAPRQRARVGSSFVRLWGGRAAEARRGAGRQSSRTEVDFFALN
ncbi:MAG: hypothetical protein NTX42_04830 [Methanothrix sp.]|nr:hypothetical protein [Methanothrix sp.]